VVATETSVGDVATVVKGMYDGHFGRVRGYTKYPVKLTLLHELARPWAKMTANKGIEPGRSRPSCFVGRKRGGGE
jgi:hypothetical protein